MQSFQILIECANLKKEDYPDCNNEQMMGSGQQISLPFQEMQDSGKWLPTTSVGLNYFP